MLRSQIMNELIEGLVVKANGYWEYGDHNMPSTVCFKEADLEKFAQLIVQECAEQVKNLWVDDYGISGADVIREHFGVDE